MNETTRADIAIIGTGPAGVSAAITARVRGKQVLLFGSKGLTTKMTKAHTIRNYPGLPDITGTDLADKLKHHLDVMGVEITEKQVTTVYAMGSYFGIQTPDIMYEASSVILAGGVVMGKPFPGEDELLGRGVSYCATCDAFFYRGKDVAVLGSGEYALHEAQALLPVAKSVTLLANGQPLTAEFPAEVVVRPEKVEAILGEQRVSGVQLAGGETVALDGVFVALGVAGSTALARKLGAEVDGNRIVTDEHMMTTLPGLYAAGDCTGGLLQVAKAVYEGALAGSEAAKALRKG